MRRKPQKKMSLKSKATLSFVFVFLCVALILFGIYYQNHKRRDYHKAIQKQVLLKGEWQTIHLNLKQNLHESYLALSSSSHLQKNSNLSEVYFKNLKSGFFEVLKKLQNTTQFGEAALEIQILLKKLNDLEKQISKTPELVIYFKQIENDLFELFAKMDQSFSQNIEGLQLGLADYEEEAMWQILIFMAVCLILAFLVTMNVIRHIKSSINQLVNFTEQVSRGYIQQKIQMNADDEVGELVAAFNNMTDNLSVASDILDERDQQKDEFMSVASHEIRTPIAILQRVIENLKSGVAGKLTEQQESFMNIAQDNILRLSHLITNLLDLARLESSTIKMSCSEIDLKNLIENVLPGFQELSLKDGLQVVAKIEPSIPHIEADPDLIVQVITNLFNNALRYAKSKIEILVTPSLNTNYAIKIGVKDDGQGISKEDQNKLFKKFSQVDRKSDAQGYKGTGLGLAICEQIVTQHGGRIHVESEPSHGTEFFFELPHKAL